MISGPRLAATFLCVAATAFGFSATSAATPKTLDDARAAIETLTLADTAAESPRLDTLMESLFPGKGEDSPCNAPTPWLSSTALCEWHKPGTARDGLPDIFVSISANGLDSVVLWGNAALSTATWRCKVAEAHRQATVCVPRSMTKDRMKALFREWQVTLNEITRPGNEPSAAPRQ